MFLMRKIPSHLWLPFPTFDLSLNNNNKRSMEAHNVSRSLSTKSGIQEANSVTVKLYPICYTVLSLHLLLYHVIYFVYGRYNI